MNAKKVFPLVAFAVLSCYAIQGQPASQPKSLSYEEASSLRTSVNRSCIRCDAEGSRDSLHTAGQ